MMTSGDSYSIGEIFSGQLVLQIPDMQRDYCWAKTIADGNGKSLVENFTEDLINQIENEDGLQLGLLYAYESPKNYIQLCDGQQRLTTLYLLLAVLYLKTNNQKIYESLILPNHDEIIPRFQYAIRESTLTFLTDLVREVIINRSKTKPELSELKKEDWYFGEYDNDPSIQNILTAIEIIDARISNLTSENPNSSCLEKLSELILSKISFLFFDMVNRTYGEEQFVVLNTTGKPLTKTENMKPLFLGGLNDKTIVEKGKTSLRIYADLWEEWEFFFWKHKHEKHQTADRGFKEFFRWIYIIEKSDLNDVLKGSEDEYNAGQIALTSFRFDLFQLNDDKIQLLDTIQEYFIAIKVLMDDSYVRSKFLMKGNRLSQIQCFELLPLLLFVRKFKIKDTTDLNYLRLKNFLRSRAKDDNVAKAIVTTAIEAIRIPQILHELNQPDIAVYSHYQQYVSKTLLSDFEAFKFDLLTKISAQRRLLENAFWKAEQLKSSQGNIEFLFNCLGILIHDTVDRFPLDEFNKLVELIKLTFEQPSDLMRRAILTFGHYYKWDGHTVKLNSHRYSLGGSPEFFGEVANNKGDISKASTVTKFVQSALSELDEITIDNISDWHKAQIKDFVREGETIREQTIEKLITDRSVISSMQSKLFCISYDDKKSYSLNRKNATGKGSYKSIIDLT